MHVLPKSGVQHANTLRAANESIYFAAPSSRLCDLLAMWHSATLWREYGRDDARALQHNPAHQALALGTWRAASSSPPSASSAFSSCPRPHPLTPPPPQRNGAARSSGPCYAHADALAVVAYSHTLRREPLGGAGELVVTVGGLVLARSSLLPPGEPVCRPATPRPATARRVTERICQWH